MQLANGTKDVVAKQIIFLLCLLLAIAILGYTLLETLQDLHVLWDFNNHAYSHGYMVLGIILYGLYERRDLLTFKPTLTILPIALLIGILWTSTNIVNIKLGEFLLLPPLFFLFIVGYVGWKQSFRFVLPTLAFFCALPIISYFTSPLQIMTTEVVSAWVRMAEMTAFIDGFFITLPYGVLHVAGSCSGVNYLSAGLTFTMLYAFLNIRKKRLQILSIVLMAALSIFANWIRVYILVAVGYESKMQSSLVEEHAFMGWAIFAIVFVFFLVIMRFIEKRYDSDFSESVGSDSDSNDQVATSQIQQASYLQLFYPILLAVAVSFTPTLSKIMSKNKATLADTEVVFPDSFSTAEISSYSNEDSVVFIGADKSYKVTGNVDGLDYSAYIVVYETQEQGKELIYYENVVGEELTKQQTLIVGGSEINYARELSTNSAVTWFYRVGRATALSPIEVKLNQLKHMFSNVIATAIILKVACTGVDCQGKQTQQVLAAINSELQKVRFES